LGEGGTSNRIKRHFRALAVSQTDNFSDKILLLSRDDVRGAGVL
jgi:hypothetical protein